MTSLFAFVLLAPQGVVLRRTPKLSDRAVYRLTGSFVVQGSKVEVKGTRTEEVTKVEEGAVTVRSSERTSVAVAGLDHDPEVAVETVTLRLDGTPVKVLVGGAESLSGLRLRNVNLLALPSAPVGTNGTWQAVGAKGRVPGYRIDYKLLGEERIGTWDTFKITAEGGETEGSSKVKATYWIEKGSGTLVRSLAELTDAVFETGAPPLSGKFELVRQS